MRTDPQAAEVRGIVERVFSKYLEREAEWGETGAGFSARWGNAAARTFPRLHEPPPCTPRLYQPAEHDAGQARPSIDETILIDRGHYVARSYRIAGYLAMWLVGVGILQFYDDRGGMLATINLFESLHPQCVAA